MKKSVCFIIAFGCRRVNFYCHFTVSKCVILLYYVQNLSNQFNKLTYRYTEKIFGKLGPLHAGPVLHMASDLQANAFIS